MKGGFPLLSINSIWLDALIVRLTKLQSYCCNITSSIIEHCSCSSLLQGHDHHLSHCFTATPVLDHFSVPVLAIVELIFMDSASGKLCV